MGALAPAPKGARRRNPSDERQTLSDKIDKAEQFYREFHWGDEPKKLKRSKVPRPPKVGVKLGDLVSVAYETTKNGEQAIWEHEFGEEGGRKPDLVMDGKTGRLHIVGGDYRVEGRGIVD